MKTVRFAKGTNFCNIKKPIRRFVYTPSIFRSVYVNVRYCVYEWIGDYHYCRDVIIV